MNYSKGVLAGMENSQRANLITKPLLVALLLELRPLELSRLKIIMNLYKVNVYLLLVTCLKSVIMKNTKSRLLNLCLVLLALSLASFSYVSDGKIKGWFLAGSQPESYEIGLETNSEKAGNVAFLKSIKSPIDGFGTIMQSFEPLDYLGKKIKLTGYIKADNIEEWSAMWMRIDGFKDGKSEVLGFDNMQDRQIKGTKDWKQYEIILDVPKEAKYISYGVLIGGTGKILIDSFKFEIIEDKKESTGNVVKLTKPTNTNFDEPN